METNWAAENLQTIRTLMERSALYRRALAPIMMFNGIAGVGGAALGWWLKISSNRGFVLLWFGIAVIALNGSFLLVRRQALKDSEPFWSPPTRRIAQALLPPFFVAAFFGIVMAYRFDENDNNIQLTLTMVWTWFYGCAIYSAAFFMPGGIKLLGCLFVMTGCGILCRLLISSQGLDSSAHLVMGASFGGLHLAYSIYLYFTEKRRNES